MKGELVVKSELNKSALAYLDDLYGEYRHLNNIIASTKIALATDYNHEVDENTSGSKSNRISRPQETIMIRYDSSPKLEFYEKVKKGIEDSLLCMTNEQKYIFKLRYDSNDYYDWETVGDIAGEKFIGKPYSHSGIYKKRYKMLELLGKKIGFC
ncbi:hypothetical protein [Lactobacillus ginsenosidimutans] [Lactiplantibacillus mudanjiangensis]|uniref:Uncharacterized protein n=1 Tax=Lactiplantibacillus mudanjiangensis TaxID=1296538 RepID=A0A660E761_9LACO|nr:hypothetical protein [Lactobacillus ginsenosidimutans] [Lactiplantibacillus mudanjiangensis]VDG28895.1 hypothetical protein [Lactobacillus ginsenosidimutans] [Lactiplantibacillus mudanjiangensis]